MRESSKIIIKWAGGEFEHMHEEFKLLNNDIFFLNELFGLHLLKGISNQDVDRNTRLIIVKWGNLNQCDE